MKNTWNNRNLSFLFRFLTFDSVKLLNCKASKIPSSDGPHKPFLILVSGTGTLTGHEVDGLFHKQKRSISRTERKRLIIE